MRVRRLTSLKRAGEKADYDNYAPLIELVVTFKLPSGRTRDLRALVDSGATDDFIHKNVIQEFGLSYTPFKTKTLVELGSPGVKAKALGESKPIFCELGSTLKHRTSFTILDLGDYDIVLGRPWQKYTKAQAEGDDLSVQTKIGRQILPRWVTNPSAKLQFIRLSRAEMKRELLHSPKFEEESYDVYLKPFQQKHKDPDLQKEIDAMRSQQPKAEEPEVEYQHEKIATGLKSPELASLLEEFKDVFPSDLPAGLPPERAFQMKIPTEPGAKPTAQAPYRVNPEAQAAVQATLDYLYKHGLVRDSVSPYAAPVTLAKKPDGTWRFCTDYRKLNNITQDDRFPLPRIDDSFDQLGQAYYFSTLDLRSGYWQCLIHPDDVHKTAFRTAYGHHEWLVVPFGLKGAPSLFQRMMNHYLRRFLGKFVLVYLDDICIYSKTKEEHLQHLRQVLEVLREQRLFAKASKCSLFQEHVNLLGFVVGGGKIATNPDKVAAITEWPQPQTVRDVRSFLGMAGFYRKFIYRYAQIAKPLTNILKSTKFKETYGYDFEKKAPVTFGEDEVKAFEGLKHALTTAPCLIIFDPTKKTEVWADASWDKSTVGAVLMQDHGHGLQPVAFMSKVCNDAQSHYPTLQQELLALKLAFDEWEHYLLPIRFTARTDHNGLKYLHTQPHLNDMQLRWLQTFSKFYFDLQYRPGTKMKVPDALSRRNKTKKDVELMLKSQKEEDKGTEETAFRISFQDDEGIKRRVYLKMSKDLGMKSNETEIPSVFDYKDDPYYGKVYETLMKDTQKLEMKPCKGIQVPQPSLQNYKLEGGNLWWLDKHYRPRKCVPQKYQSLIIQEFHDTPLGGHFGVDKTHAAIRERFVWPFMGHHIEQFVKTCDACQKNKSSHKKMMGTPQLYTTPTQPWEHVSIDGCGPFPKTKRGNDYIMGFICNLCREAVIAPCSKTITAKETALLFIKEVLPRAAGMPRVITSDRGPQFVAHFWKELWKALESKVAYAAPFHASSNPFQERQNKTFEENLRSYINALHNDWDDKVYIYEFAYNNSVNPSTGETPFFLSHGRRPLLPIDVAQKSKSPAVDEFLLNLRNSIAEARDHIRRRQEKVADKRATKMTPVDFKPGDLVLLKTDHYNLKLPSKKLAPRYLGPLKVIDIRGPNTVVIEVPPRLSRIQPIQNVEFLKRYYPRSEDIGPTHQPDPPEIINDHEEFEVEEILAHRHKGKRVEYLVRFLSYGPEDDLWLPLKNLDNAQDLVAEYHKRQQDELSMTDRPRRRQTTSRHLKRLGHEWL